MLPRMTTTMLLGVPASVKTTIHHAGMHDDERAHTQEGDRVGKVAQHRFQQFKHALHQVVAHAARRLPGLTLDHRGQQLGKQQQDQSRPPCR